MPSFINQDIERFYSVAQQRDFARDFLFRVKTVANVTGLPLLQEQDLVYVTAAKLPGRSITNNKVPYMGLDFNVPGTAVYDGSDSYDMEFYLDAQANDLRQKFELASRDVFNDLTSGGDYRIPGENAIIVLAQLDKGLKDTGVFYNLIGAQVRKINSLDYKISDGKGDVMKLGVSLSYHFYTSGPEAKPGAGAPAA